MPRQPGLCAKYTQMSCMCKKSRTKDGVLTLCNGLVSIANCSPEALILGFYPRAKSRFFHRFSVSQPPLRGNRRVTICTKDHCIIVPLRSGGKFVNLINLLRRDKLLPQSCEICWQRTEKYSKKSPVFCGCVTSFPQTTQKRGSSVGKTIW